MPFSLSSVTVKAYFLPKNCQYLTKNCSALILKKNRICFDSEPIISGTSHFSLLEMCYSYLRSRCFSAASTRRKFKMDASCAFKPSIWLLGIRSAFIKLFMVEVDGIAVEVSGSLWWRWCNGCKFGGGCGVCARKWNPMAAFGLCRCGMKRGACKNKLNRAVERRNRQT